MEVGCWVSPVSDITHWAGGKVKKDKIYEIVKFGTDRYDAFLRDIKDLTLTNCYVHNLVVVKTKECVDFDRKLGNIINEE